MRCQWRQCEGVGKVEVRKIIKLVVQGLHHIELVVLVLVILLLCGLVFGGEKNVLHGVDTHSDSAFDVGGWGWGGADACATKAVATQAAHCIGD